MHEGQFVGFVLGVEHYGVDIMGVEEIIRLMEITPVPRAPSFVEGIINLRGRIIPVIDLRKRLKITPRGTAEDLRIIVMRLEEKRLGFIVDRVEQVMHINEERIETSLNATANARQYVEGVAKTPKGMVILLDVLKVFSPDEKMQIAKIG